MKKGQGALEYLMTYGWALLIIVVVGAALYALGVLNPATYTKSTCAGFSYFSYQDQLFSPVANGNFTIVLYNGNQDVTIEKMELDSVENTTALYGDTTPSATKKFTLSGVGYDTSKQSGDAFSYTVTITYSTGDLTGKSDKATCTGTVQ